MLCFLCTSNVLLVLALRTMANSLKEAGCTMKKSMAKSTRHELTRVTWLDICRDTEITRRNFEKKSNLDEPWMRSNARVSPGYQYALCMASTNRVCWFGLAQRLGTGG